MEPTPRPSEVPSGTGVAINAIWSVIASLVPSIAVTLASIVMARRLGATAFGDYIFAVFLYAGGAQVAAWGLRGATTRYVAVARASSSGHLEREIVSSTLRAAVFGALVVAAVISASSLLFESRRLEMALAAAVVIPLTLTTVLAAVLSGREHFRRLAVWQLATGFLNPALTIIVVLGGGGVVEVLVVDVIASALSCVWIGAAARPLSLARGVRVPEGFWRFARQDAILVVLGIIVFQRSEVIFLDFFADSEEIAMYGVAFGLSQIVWRLTGPIVAALNPALARLLGGAPAEARHVLIVQRTLQLSFLIGLPLSAVGYVLTKPVVLLLYGEQYGDAVTPARVLFTAGWAMMMGSVFHGIAAGKGILRPIIIATACGAAVNITLDIVLIRSYGATGAALANVLAQLLLTAMLYRSIAAMVPGVRLKPLLRVIPAVSLAALVALPFADSRGLLPLIAATFLSMATFGISLSFSGAIDDESRGILASVTGLPDRLFASRK